jgi:hypothetical protein
MNFANRTLSKLLFELLFMKLVLNLKIISSQKYRYS